MNNRAEFARAKKVVHARLAFCIHLAAFLVVNALLVVINLTTSSARLWFLWPLCGWGLGILVHGLVTFVLPGMRSRMIAREVRQQTARE